MKQYIVPAKAMAVTVVDLLYDGAASAKRVVESFKPLTTKKDYPGFMARLVEPPGEG